MKEKQFSLSTRKKSFEIITGFLTSAMHSSVNFKVLTELLNKH